MFEKIKRGGVALASALLAVGALGFAQPALGADSEAQTAALSQAYLTKVIVAPNTNNDIGGDQFTFTFTTADEDLQDDSVTVADVNFAAIAPLIIKGKTTAGTQSGQTAIKIPIDDILDAENTDSNSAYATYVVGTRTATTFPHAGLYTYKVVESSLENNSGDPRQNINKSNAEYLMKVLVKNGEDGKPTPDTVTVEKIKNDEGTPEDETPGDDNGRKVDPKKPDVREPDGSVKDKTNDGDDEDNKKKKAGDDRGRDVEGFSFTNEYVSGDEVVLAKQVEGNYGDHTKLFPVTFAVTDDAAPLENTKHDEHSGTIITYYIASGDYDAGSGSYNNKVTDSNRYTGADGSVASYLETTKQLWDSPTSAATPTLHATNDYEHYVEFKEDGSGHHVATIEAKLAHGDKIVVTGLYGLENKTGSSGSEVTYRRRQTVGLKATSTYVVTEDNTDNYKPTVKEYENKNKDAANVASHGRVMTQDSTTNAWSTTGYVWNDGAYVELTNTFDDTSVTPTGIFINNLPYILMIGIPVVVFAGMFINKRRQANDLA